MENANSPEYLEKIKIAVIENLKKTAPVPSVQMQDVPREGLGMSDEQEAELDDMDEDENKDVRMTQRRWEKRVARQDEFEESDDEDMARANGVYKPNGRSRQETNFGNDDKNDDTMEIDSGVATPAEPAAEAAADNDETMIDEAQAEAAEAEAEKPAATEQPAASEEPKVDGDGDVDMTEAATVDEKPAEATIKKEEVEGTSAAEAERKKSPVGGNGERASSDEAVPPKQRASGSPEASGATDTKPAEETQAKEAASDKGAEAAEKKADDNEAKA